MNSRLILLALPLVFFACEADEDDPTLIGSWTVTAFDEYSGASCTGTPEWTLDSITASGQNLSLTMEFTEDQVTMVSDASMSADAICTMMGGTLDGDSCGFSPYYGNFAVDEMCVNMMEGTYANSTCSRGDSETSSYTTDEDAITVTHYAGTDSAEVETGTWSIASDVLTMSLASDSSCTSLTLSK